MTAPLVFLDTETTGVDPRRNDIWEIGLVHRKDGVDTTYLAQIWPDLTAADPTGLRISRFYERERMTRQHDDRNTIAYPAVRVDPGSGEIDSYTPSQVAWDLTTFLDGAHVIGAVPSFDANFLERFLRRHQQAPTWHYHLIDVENVAVGYLWANAHEDGHGKSLLPPYSSDELAKMCGVAPPSDEDRHTALGDAKWVMRWWDTMHDGVRNEGG